MVNASASLLAAALILAIAPGAGLGASPRADPELVGDVQQALGKGSFPWYDSASDRAKPVALPREPAPSSAAPSSNDGSWTRWAGNLISLLGFGLGLAVLIGLMIWFWRIYEPTDGSEAASAKAGGSPSRVDALPEGMRAGLESSDPWTEAIRRRDRGDLAGAIVFLFAHQLLTLSRLGLVRLAPGRTGRQLLRSVTDAELRTLVLPTLRLFEVVYYGHRTPNLGEFSAVWERAEAFERRVSVGVAS